MTMAKLKVAPLSLSHTYSGCELSGQWIFALMHPAPVNAHTQATFETPKLSLSLSLNRRNSLPDLTFCNFRASNSALCVVQKRRLTEINALNF